VKNLPYQLIGEIPKVEWSPDQEFAKLVLSVDLMNQRLQKEGNQLC
jgi:hypothetical protein